MDFEEILTSIGDYGLYQKKLLYFVLIPYSLMIPWAHSSTVFMISTPRHTCKVPELRNLSFDLQMMLTSPKTIDYPQNSVCSMMDLDYSKLLIQLNLNSSKLDDLNEIKKRIKNYYDKNKPKFKKCETYVFDTENYDETAATAFNLVCENEKLSDNILSICGLGAIIGTPLFGWMSDKIGRKKTMWVINIIFLIGSLSPSISYLKTYNAFLGRFLITAVVNTLFQVPFILATELVGPDKRTMLGFVTTLAWGIGICILPGYTYLFRNWVYMNHMIILTGLFYLSITFYILESPRWLLSSSRIEEAEKVLKKIAIINKIPDAEETMFVQKLELVGRKSSCLSKTQINIKPDSTLTLFTNKKIRKLFIIITLGYVANAISYNAINLNTFSLSGNQFLNYFLLSFIEIPASVLAFYVMETRLGRRWSGSLFLLIFAFLNLLAILIHNYTFVITLNVIGKLLISISFTAIYQISVEIYPTPLRNQGLSLSGTISSINSIVLPYFIDRNQFSDNFAVMSIITLICFLSAVSFSFIPETLYEVLPQTVADAEMFGEDKKYFSLARKKKDSNEIKVNKSNEESNLNNINDKNSNRYNNNALSLDDINYK